MPLYLQFVNSIITEIKTGHIKPGMKIPGTRIMAQNLNLNRQTVVKAYDELYAQGWLIAKNAKGSFINQQLPEVHPRKLSAFQNTNKMAEKTGYRFKQNDIIHIPAKPNRHLIGFHDGPDVRLVPIELLNRGYKSILNRSTGLKLFSYTDVEGTTFVRKSISEYLNGSRGLQTKSENLLITRGAQMALFLLSSVLINKNDIVVTASLSFRYADLCFLNAGAKLQRIPLDDYGIDVDALESLCRKKKIRAIYVTSHHHYPTTVTLCASRRMKLIQLAEQFGFIIIEDDYDYEFHYESSPILPLASADQKGMVIYIGSFSKTLTPALRLGYISAPVNLIQEVSKYRQIIDVQGDAVMEHTVAELLNDGQIKRHLKKVILIYKERRDFMCSLLLEKLSDIIDFKIPEGGLSVWAQFDKKYSVPLLAEKMFKKDVILSKGLIHNYSVKKPLNCTRLGFGWMNPDECEKAIQVLEKSIRS